LNSIFKRKYNTKLQELPRLTLLIKGFDQDVKQKAAIFNDVLLEEFVVARKDNAYWLVRQAMWLSLGTCACRSAWTSCWRRFKEARRVQAAQE
jgi:hypothetical protein